MFQPEIQLNNTTTTDLISTAANTQRDAFITAVANQTHVRSTVNEEFVAAQEGMVILVAGVYKLSMTAVQAWAYAPKEQSSA